MITGKEPYDSFLGTLPLNLKLLRELLGVTSIELSPRENTPLYFCWPHAAGAPATVRIACDNVMAVEVLTQHAWQRGELDFAASVLAGEPPITLVDVGANMGLVTRQLLARLPNIAHAYVYEPHPGNFELLSFNLAPFERVEYVNAALSNAEGRLEFFLDPENCGNYSLIQAAMPAEHASTVVEAISALNESRRWLAHASPVFYKSDTQGYDEFIATQLDPRFWNSVLGGIMELWRIDKPDCDAARLEEILDGFPNKFLLHTPAERLSTAHVLDYTGGRDGLFADLCFWR
jgi:FkbM family methyltransferase